MPNQSSFLFIFQTVKLQDRMIHEEKSTPLHLMLLFRTVMQLVGKTMRKSNHAAMNGVNVPSERELERYVKKLENVLKENGDLKSKLVEQEERIRVLESSRQNGPLLSAASVHDSTFTKELSRRMNNEEAKTADLEILFAEGNRLNEELQRQVATIARDQEASKATISRLQRQFESMSHSLALRNVMMTDLDDFVTDGL